MGGQDWSGLDPRLWPAAQHGRVVRRFALYRHRDRSGVSGCGVAALGAQWPDGACVLQWQTPPRGLGLYRGLHDLLAIHGHGGDSEILWFDEE